MLKKTLFISVLMIGLVSNGYAESCQVESGPPPVVADYITSVRDELTKLKQAYPYACGKPGSPTANLDRTLNILDKAKEKVPQMNDIVLDFRFNVITAWNGEQRSPVVRDGKIFADLERRTILPALDTMAANCQLDNATVKNTLTTLIARNHSLENYYKSVTLGETGRVGDDEIKSAIFDAYNPSATRACKGQFSGEQNTKKILENLQDIGKGIDKSLTDWKQAIALFQGRSNKGNYTDIQRKLLAEELNRQGLGKRAKDQILANFDCYKDKTLGKDGIEEKATARQTCLTFPVVGYEQLANFFDAKKYTAKTSEEWTNIEKQNTIRNGFQLDVLGMYNTLMASSSYEQAETDGILGNLVNLHASLSAINESLEKRNPVMWQNCMKSRPDIQCPR